jgi:hypothetical protein
MTIKEKIGGYLVKLSLNHEEATDGTWIIRDRSNGLSNIVVVAADPVVIFRVNVMPLPKSNKEKFFEKLLQLNATEIVHGAYALEGNNVIIIDTLEANTMDLEEFQASIDAIGFALSSHYPVLQGFRK